MYETVKSRLAVRYHQSISNGQIHWMKNHVDPVMIKAAVAMYSRCYWKGQKLKEESS